MLAHRNDFMAVQFSPLTWRASWADREPARDNLRRCSYCGSVHPDDLLNALKSGGRLELSDMKYKWPHKYYVKNVPNELAGQTVRVGSRSGPTELPDGTPALPDLTAEELAAGRYRRDIMGQAPRDAVVKFYSEHMVDAGESFAELQAAVLQSSGVLFSIKDDGTLHWRIA